jgi:hypothetical protein
MGKDGRWGGWLPPKGEGEVAFEDLKVLATSLSMIISLLCLLCLATLKAPLVFASFYFNAYS